MADITTPIADDEYGAHPVRPVPPDYSRGEITAPEYLEIGPVVAHITKAQRLEREKRVLEIECEQLRARIRELEKNHG